MKAILVTLLLACSQNAAPLTAEPPTTPAKKDAAMAESLSPAGDKHPGEIVFEDKVEHTTKTKRATEVPVSIAWVKVETAWVPVVKIVITGAGQIREMSKYGPNEQFLNSTTATLGPPPTK